MANMEAKEVPMKEVEVEDEGDDVIHVTTIGKKKKGAVEIEKKSRVRKPNKHNFSE